MFNSNKLYQLIIDVLPSKEFLIAYSGGLDSHVLLHAMAALRIEHPEIQIHAIHIHHGLSANAEQWAAHCQQVCNELQVSLKIFKIDLTTARLSGESIEAAARQMRYKIFAEQLQQDRCLLTAHTQNDQAETILLQLLRGAGPKGLAAMPLITDFAAGLHLRPLLNNTRTELAEYAHQYKLQWIEDESNLDPKYARNFLRHQILPLLKRHWPAATKTLSRSAQHCAEASVLLDELAEQDLSHVGRISASSRVIRHCMSVIQANPASIYNVLSISALLQLSPARQRNLIRYWLEQGKFLLPSTAKLEQIQQDVLHCTQDANPLVAWSGAEIRRYQDFIYAMPPLLPHDRSIIIPWDLKGPLILPNNLGVLTVDEVFAKNNYPAGSVTVRFRQGGEKCRLKGHAHTSELKKLFQQWNVPPWLRDRIPLVYVGDKLSVIAGYGACE